MKVKKIKEEVKHLMLIEEFPDSDSRLVVFEDTSGRLMVSEELAGRGLVQSFCIETLVSRAKQDLRDGSLRSAREHFEEIINTKLAGMERRLQVEMNKLSSMIMQVEKRKPRFGWRNDE